MPHETFGSVQTVFGRHDNMGREYVHHLLGRGTDRMLSF